ncbi:MAG TPA: hypothetical protein VIH90_00305 [Candidatus Saccharimonadales bacterium]
MSTEDNGSEQKPTIVLSKKHGKFISIGTIGVIAVLVVLALILLISNYVEKSKPTGDCVKDTKSTACQELKLATPLLPAPKARQLSVVAAKIQSLKNYQKDTNLEYVLLTYNINMSDPSGASKNYNLLVADYKPSIGYDSLLGKNALKPAVLKTIVDALQQIKLHPNFHIYGMKQ